MIKLLEKIKKYFEIKYCNEGGTTHEWEWDNSFFYRDKINAIICVRCGVRTERHTTGY